MTGAQYPVNPVISLDPQLIRIEPNPDHSSLFFGSDLVYPQLQPFFGESPLEYFGKRFIMVYPIRCYYVILCPHQMLGFIMFYIYLLTLPLKFPVIFAIEICRLVEFCTSTMNMWREQKEDAAAQPVLGDQTCTSLQQPVTLCGCKKLMMPHPVN